MAIVGYQKQLEEVTQKIAALRSQLGHSGPGRPKATAAKGETAKRTMSASARSRIAAAQKARWAAYRKDQGGDGKAVAANATAPKPKRKLSAAGRKAIIAATRKRWAAVRAAKAAGQ